MPAAATAGIAPGMALNSALALLPELQVLARDERRERELLQALAEWAVRFTPRVSLEPPDAVLLEVRGSLRLFGGVRSLCARLRAELQAAGLEPCLALDADATSVALARAFGHRKLPCAAEKSSREHWRHCRSPAPAGPDAVLKRLRRWACGRSAIACRLPRDGFARRFEPRMLDMLDRAVGAASGST